MKPFTQGLKIHLRPDSEEVVVPVTYSGMFSSQVLLFVKIRQDQTASESKKRIIIMTFRDIYLYLLLFFNILG